MPFHARLRRASLVRPLLWPLAIATAAHALSRSASAAPKTAATSPTPANVATAPTSTTPTTPTTPTATGRIQGLVEISASLTARRPQFRIYADPGAGAVPPPAPKRAEALAAEGRNVVIYLEGDAATLTGDPARLAAAHRGRIAQRNERFSPHVLAVVTGATVEFPNEDPFYHNVFSLSSAAGSKGFDLGRYPQGTSRSWTFPRAGTVQVSCHIHSDMSAVLLVLANPFFATPDETRHYVIDDVPEGEYTIVGWHERLMKPVTHKVRVVAGQTATIDFDIPLSRDGDRE